ncbi:MAG TPA: hypothetical protein VM386_01480, partial [Acidimicrobiales bacterium]|nr:hypothetical protein [Acidimicrobiales bacterium]
MAVAMVVGAVTGCTTGDEPQPAERPTSSIDERLAQLSGAGVFVGGVAMTGSLVALHFDRTDPRAVGMRMFVTDGLPDGNAEWFEGKASGDSFSFTSTSGKARIEGKIEAFETDGTIT